MVKVANEADFILNRMRADDIRKGEEFDQLCSQTSNERTQEEKLCDHFITVSRQRYERNALRLKDKFLSQMINDQFNYLNHSCPFWKLDLWEDDLRRRRRLVPDLNGNSHEQSLENLAASKIDEEDLITTVLKDESLLKQTKQPKTQSFLQEENEDLSQIDEKDLEHDFSGPIRYSTGCFLINGTLPIQGVLAMTHNSMLFDATDEKNLDPQVEHFLEIESK